MEFWFTKLLAVVSVISMVLREMYNWYTTYLIEPSGKFAYIVYILSFAAIGFMFYYFIKSNVRKGVRAIGRLRR